MAAGATGRERGRRGPEEHRDTVPIGVDMAYALQDL